MGVETESYCGLCANYNPLPDRAEKIKYPWGGYDILYINEGICSKNNTTVSSLCPGCKNYYRNTNFFKRKETAL